MAVAKINTVDTRQFNAMCEQLAGLTGKPHLQVVRSELGSVLEKTLQYTRSASVSKIRHRYDQFVPLGIDSYSPKQTRRFGGNLKGNNLIYFMDNRYPSELWSRLKNRRVQLIERLMAARGLAKKSWLELAEILGLKIAFPGYVAKATPRSGKTYKNITAKQQATSAGVSITIENAQPTVNAIGGGAALRRAMVGRSKFFDRNASLSVFADVKKIAKAYPGLKIKAT